ncbi:NAD(+) ADP-ribosyltransferase, partial [Acanthamoeba castellanii str. Neff]
GNAWEERAAFDKKPKKYHLVKVDAERERSIANLLKPFDVEIEDDIVEQQQPTNKNANKNDAPKYPASKLPVPLQHAIKALTDSTMLTQAMRTAGIDTDAMPLGRLTKEDIEAAKQILADIRKLLHKIHPPATPAAAEEKADEDDEEEENEDEDEENEDEEDEERPKKKKKTAAAPATATGGEKPKELTLDEARVFFEQIAELSNRFYELIPHANYTVESIPPLDNENLLNEKFTMLGNLAEIQTASKILLGAHYRAKELNPLDYCYSAMNIRLNDIEKETDEYKTLMTYIKNTEQGALRGKFITNIYNLQRKGEPERFQKWEDLHNHQLL